MKALESIVALAPSFGCRIGLSVLAKDWRGPDRYVFCILLLCATGEGSLVSRAHRITLCSQAVYYVNGISIRIDNSRI